MFKSFSGIFLRKLHFSILKSAFSNGWSKSIVLENKVAINFDFRSGAKKSGHLDYPLQSNDPKVNMPKYAYAIFAIFTFGP